MNLKGDLPEGYSDGGAKTVTGIGAATGRNIATLAASDADLAAARDAAESPVAIRGALATATDAGVQATLVQRYGEMLVKASNTHSTLMRKYGIEGPYKG